MTITNLPPRSRVEQVALTFSGGGFRAAGFALGCLSYMEVLPLGNQKFASAVGFIASASGGTITNLAYTVAQRKGQAFREVYKTMIESMLMGTRIIDEVFRIIGEKDCWSDREHKSRNLINAFSLAYDRLLFQQETFEILMRPVAAGQAVEGVCVNTTEFRNGMLFRFQNDGVAGNRFLHFRKNAAALGLLRLGDILAASSCFPVGFEPMVFPRDFTHKGLDAEALRAGMSEWRAARTAGEESGADAAGEVPAGKRLTFAFMDGGIDDNQGIDSLMRAEGRMQNRNGFGYDLFLCCDVSSNYTDGYDFPEENTRSWWQKGSIGGYATFILLLLALSLLGIFFGILPGLAFALLGISGLLAVMMGGLLYKALRAHGRARKRRNTFGMLIFQHIGIFLRLKLSVILQMVGSRASSAGYLAAVVFMKKIRRLSYDRLFSHIEEIRQANGDVGLKHFSQFALQNAIYLLSRRNDDQRRTDLKNESWHRDDLTIILDDKAVALDELLEPGGAVQKVADVATEMETTLWFDKDQIAAGRPAALIAAGQFTTCYNLLRWAFRFDRKDAYWRTLQDRLVADWVKFKNNPFWLYDQYGMEDQP